jgi:tRNA-dihydrouridine synthase B
VSVAAQRRSEVAVQRRPSPLQALEDGAPAHASFDGWPAAASRSYRIGPVVVDPPVAMAPMADITDVLFHEVLRDVGGPGLYTAEMVSSTALARGSRKTLTMLRRPAGCPSFAVQIFGAVPEDMALAARMAADEGADVVDVNMGCPAKKVTGNACGSSLLRDLPLVGRILRAIRAAMPASVPLTLKYRLGWDSASHNFVDVGRVAESEGLAALTLHGRTRQQMFEGRADWSAVRELKAAVLIPVVGNGDVMTAHEVAARLAESGCDGVMVARAALVNPWIFRQVRELHAGLPVTEPSLSERRTVILDHHDRLRAAHDDMLALHRVRKFVGYYTKGLSGGSEFRKLLNDLRDGAALRSAVGAFFDGLEDAAARGERVEAAAGLLPEE